MPTNLMNLDQARVLNPLLTDVARGYMQAPLIADWLFPRVPVRSRKGQLLQFGKDAFRIRNTKRGPGEQIPRVNISYGTAAYALEQHALGVSVPVETTEEARVVADVELFDESLQTISQNVRLEIENEAAVLATNAANYSASNKATVTSTDRWDTDTGDVFGQLATGKDAIRQKVGVRPNTLVIGPKVLTALQKNAKILDRLKYTSSQIPSLEDLARLFQLEKVVSGEAVVADDTDTFSDIWGTFAVLAYVSTGSKSRRTPSYGYNYELENMPVVTAPEFNRSNRSFEGEYIYEHGLYIAGADAGFLYSTVVS
jgi:hypothetical protein